MARKQAERQVFRPKVGEYVLIGSSGVTLPGDWFVAKVLWADGEEILTEHEAPSHGRCRQVLTIAHVRAIGSISELGQFKETSRVAVADLSRRVREAESALGDARKAVWDKLDDLAEDARRLSAPAFQLEG